MGSMKTETAVRKSVETVMPPIVRKLIKTAGNQHTILEVTSIINRTNRLLALLDLLLDLPDRCDLTDL